MLLLYARATMVLIQMRMSLILTATASGRVKRKRTVTCFVLCQLMVGTDNELLKLCNTFFRTYKEKQHIARKNMRCRVNSVAILMKYTGFTEAAYSGSKNKEPFNQLWQHRLERC